MPDKDSVLVMLSRGEYRVPADVLERYGDDLLSALNNGAIVMPIENNFQRDRYGFSDKADQKFFEESRKLSPKFPDVATVLVRRQKRREELAARILLAIGALFLIAVPFADHPIFMALASGISFLGFCCVCVVAGNRAHARAGASGNPF